MTRIRVASSNFLLFTLLLLPLISARFGGDFRAFVHNRYGLEIAQKLERLDIGEDASFGGNEAGEGRYRGQPVIIVHGITNKVSRFQHTVNELRKHGYKGGVFGTTYGDGGTTPAGLVEMKCEYVKQIRSLIIAVYEYIGDKVDIIAYSMGSPIARKAVMGGLCVDTREVIGPPITELVDTFLSVAGSNSGTTLCFVPIPVGTCNRKNGLHCDSEFLADINSQQRYEGSHTFSIFSTHDDKVGYRACGKLASPIRGEDGFVRKKNLNHDQTMDTTTGLQINFIRKHKP
ncbi:unnamed protein product [Bursaphelenchus okinawaensis]|uniref:Uncharacterized protein n=1 Tax=Bursaphelenchus okinawaensis TaxID=465554 RepID=A0A811KB11_9BILA|nr:unnamed protein product [Bursaphelenchus okinawaensis]CAG9098399.1 unnamed protein product [Bursaphelenchus okinawaensis]